MRLRQGFRIVGLLLGFAALIGLSILTREPSHNGVSLSEWLDRLSSCNQSDTETARLAIRQIGSKAVPYLVKMLQRKDSAAKIQLHRLLAKQSLIHVQFSWAGKQHEKAVLGFQALGCEAINAMLPLVAVLNDTNAGAAQMTHGTSCFPSAPAAQRALQALGAEVVWAAIPLVKNDTSQRWLYYDLLYKNFSKGTDSDEDVPVIGRILEECRFADIRHDAASALGAMRRWPEVAAPLLRRRLILDPDASVKAMAAYALRCFGENLTSPLPEPDPIIDPDTGLPKGPDSPVTHRPLPPL